MGQLKPPSASISAARSYEKSTRFSSLSRYTIFESLQFHDFRWLWLGTFASFMAMSMQMITRSWLVLRLSDDSPLALSLVIMSFAAPMTFASLIGGALADRIPRKLMIMFSQSGNALITLLLASLDISGLIEFWHLLVIGLVNGTLVAFNMPSRQAIISDIVPANKLMNAISLNNSGMNLTRVVGPALAGVLIIYMDTAGVFYIIAGMYIFSVLSIAMVHTKKTTRGHSRKGMTSDIREGLSYAARNPTLLGLIIMAFMPALFGFSYFALLPAWAREALDVQSDGLGLLMMIMGIGALTGTLILASINNFTRRGAVLLVNSVAWGIALAIFSQITSYAMAVPFLLLIGFLSSIFMAINMMLMQTYAAPEMRGRIMSIIMMTFGVMPLSGVPFGALAESIGTPNALSLSGLMLAIFTIIFAIRYPRFLKIA